MFRCLRTAGCLSIALLLVACASTGGPPVEQKVATAPAPTPPPATLFGKFDLRKNGKPFEVTETAWLGVNAFSVLVLPEGENRALALETDAKGWFAWRLKPGTYTMPAFVYIGGSAITGRVVGALNRQFTVTEGDRGVYLGHLTVDVERPGVELRDAQEDASAEYAKRNPQAAALSKRLLKPAPRLGSFRTVHSACAEQWGITCSRNAEGIEPISPTVTRGAHRSTFTPVATRSPDLTWKRSAKPGITYDVAIWEAAAYRVPSALVDNYLPGRVVRYEENLAEPQLRLQTPLKPGTKYYWSVRMRDGDAVSSWSRVGQVALMVVAMTSSRGGWFGFETP